MKLYECKECGGEFEADSQGAQNSVPACVDCGSTNVKMLNSGRIEFDPSEGEYETGESEGTDLEDESEPGSLFDRREQDDDDEET